MILPLKTLTMTTKEMPASSLVGRGSISHCDRKKILFKRLMLPTAHKSHCMEVWGAAKADT